MRKIAIVVPLALALAGCGGSRPESAGTKVVYQIVEREVPRPCPVAVPAKPLALARPLPADPGALVSLLAAKLAEWAGPGGYGEKAGAGLEICTRPPTVAE